jgi:hypothetical protein
MTPPVVRRLEAAAGRNLADYVAALRRVAPELGAECIDIAGGVAAFTGIGSPLTTVKGVGPQLSPRDLDEIETFFRDHGATAVSIELAPWPGGAADQVLRERRYDPADREDVVAAIAATERSGGTSPAETMPRRAWVAVMRRTSEMPDASPMDALVTAAAHLPDAQLYGVREDDRWIACAQSVACGDVLIFGNDGTLPEARRHGAQTALIAARLAATPDGKLAMAEVEPGSGSERNYLRCGFQIAYARSQYLKVLSATSGRDGPSQAPSDLHSPFAA